MANNIEQILSSLLDINGSKASALVDYQSGMLLGSAGETLLDLELAAAGNTEVVRAKLETMKTLGIDGAIEDILITLEDQFHIIRPCASHEGLFIYLVLDKAKSNLALARRAVLSCEAGLKL